MLFSKRRCGHWNKKYRKRKECVFLPAKTKDTSKGRAFLGIRASISLEAACVLPWFLFAMLAMMHFFQVMTVQGAVLAGMQDTAKDMAAYAYIRQLGVTAGDGLAADLITGGISTAYAKMSVEKKASFQDKDGTLHFYKTSFWDEDIIDLAVTYSAKNTYTLLPIPKTKTALRARVRAWTGRDGNGSGDEEAEEGEEEQVWVTETGTVYHKDPNCTHLKLSVRRVPAGDVPSLRNKSGAKYHRCERCPSGGGSSVFVTDHGNRYHTSAGCSGLKRTVRQVPASEVGDWRACAKCGGSA